MESKYSGLGRPRVAESTVKIQTLVESSIVRRLKHIAADRGVIPTVIYREALEQYVARHEAEATQ